ncbi:MAG: sulfur carrier protein ThiS [Bacteroidales bacterium]|jgi:sulfur carrier protein|nr:sulfur carrier protein ThiS [Bacteroidales bacterium]
MSKIKVNEEIQEVTLPLSLTELIRTNSATPEMVSVQLNGDFIPQEKFPSTGLQDGDEVDLLYFMGGGAR